MGSWRGVGTLLGAHCLIVLFAVSLCGCAAIDQFSTRAQDYNRETAESKSNQILLNVVRSAYSQPLQFTEVSSVSANASVNGTLAATVPFPLDIAARTGARTISATPSAALTGGNTVSVANLNTQEFYQGLQKPLSKAQITYYLFSGFYDLDPDALLPLFVSEIQVTDSHGKKIVLRNRATTLSSFATFFTATSQLVRGGLRTEPSGKAKPTNVGPELDEAEARDPKLLSALISSASSSSSDSGGAGITLAAVHRDEGGVKKIKYQLQKGGGAGGDDQFCFANVKESEADPNMQTTTPIRANRHVVYLTVADGKGTLPITISPSQFCGHSAGAKGHGEYQKLDFKTRSLEEIFHFLGEIVRTELALAADAESLAVPFADGHDFRLFHVEHRLPVGEEPWAVINGQIFVVRIDTSGKYDASSRVLQLMTDLLALQSSAKNLPAPNLIAITQ